MRNVSAALSAGVLLLATTVGFTGEVAGPHPCSPACAECATCQTSPACCGDSCLDKLCLWFSYRPGKCCCGCCPRCSPCGMPPLYLWFLCPGSGVDGPGGCATCGGGRGPMVVSQDHPAASQPATPAAQAPCETCGEPSGAPCPTCKPASHVINVSYDETVRPVEGGHDLLSRIKFYMSR